MQPTITDVLDFLHKLYSENLGYSAINTARSMLSTFVSLDGVDAGKHHLVCRYMKGVENSRPTLPKYSFTWDTGVVIRHYKSVVIEENNLLKQSQKVATLLAILSGQRARETLSLIDIRNITFEENFAIIRIADPTKTTTSRHHNGEIRLPKFEVESVCPVTALKLYMDITKTIRASVTALFITSTRPYKRASKDTLARWIKSALQEAGINIEIFSPHSTRSASTSKARHSVTLGTILKTGGWRSERTFAKHYHKEILHEESFAKSILLG